MSNTSPEILQMKSELADTYLKEFSAKKELNILQKTAISFFEKKMKELLLRDTQLTDDIGDYNLTWLQQKIAAMSPKTTEFVIAFLKEKQKQLLIAQTKEDLDNLKKWIVPTPKPKDTDPVPQSWWEEVDWSDAGETEKKEPPKASYDNDPDNMHLWQGRDAYKDIAMMAWWAWAEYIVRPMMRRAGIFDKAKAEKLWATLSGDEVKRWMTDVKKMLEARARSPKLLPVQQQNIEKMIATFDDAIASSDAVKELQAWKTLAQKWVINNDFLLGMKPQQVEELSSVMLQIKNDKALMQSLSATTDPTLISDILQKKWVTVHPDVLTMLAHTDDAEAVVNVLSKGNELMKLSKALQSIPILDFVCMGIEINSYMDEKEEIEKMRNQERAENALSKARTHLWIDSLFIWVPALWATSSAVYSMCTGLACAWPWWWVLIWCIWAAEVGKYAMDKWYYEVRDYYKQDKYDFAAQYRAEIKQAIWASIAWSSWDNFELSLNERMCEMMKWVDDTRKMQTLDDALWAMIYLEEKDSYPLIANDMFIQSQEKKYDELSPEAKVFFDSVKKSLAEQKSELEKEKALLNQHVAQRMEYIKEYLLWGSKFADTKNALTGGTWIAHIENIIAESRLYASMKNNTAFSWTDIVEYKERMKNGLIEKNKELVNKLDALQKNPEQYKEFIRQVQLFKMAWLLEQSEYAHMSEMIDIINQYESNRLLYAPIEKQSLSSTMDANYVQIQKTLQTLYEWGEIAPSISKFTQAQVEEELSAPIENSPRFNEVQEYSDSVFQNVMYRIAKEFHGYEGENEITQLQSRFKEEKWNATWFYYDPESGKRFVNNDNAKDRAIDILLFNSLSAEEIYEELFKETPYRSIVGTLLTPWMRWLVPVYLNPADKDVLDTPTETNDKAFNKEILTKILGIIKTEKVNQSVENKKQVDDKIRAYIQENTTPGEYIELPYYLIHDAARAWLGQLQYWYFSYNPEQKKIVAYTREQYISKALHLTWVEKKLAWVSWELDAKKVEMIAKIQWLQKKMKDTATKIQWWWRGDVLYDPVGESIHSRWKNIKCTLTPDWLWKVGDDSTVYTTPEQAAFAANIYNRVSWHYKIQNKDATFEYNEIYWIVNTNDRSWKRARLPVTVVSNSSIHQNITQWKDDQVIKNVLIQLNKI